MAVSLDKVDISHANTLRVKTKYSSSGYFNYPSTLYIFGLLLDNCGNILHKWKKMVTKNDNIWVKRLGISKKLLNLVKLRGKYDILTIQENGKTCIR